MENKMTETTTVDTDVTLYFDHGGKVFRVEQCGRTYEINDPLNIGNCEFAKLKIERISGVNLEFEEPPLCSYCEGQGTVYVKRNSRGEVDYIDGSPTNETSRCDMCHGEGVEQ